MPAVRIFPDASSIASSAGFALAQNCLALLGLMEALVSDAIGALIGGQVFVHDIENPDQEPRLE